MPSIFRPRPGGFRLFAALRPSPAPSLVPALARRRAIFGPVELREERIHAFSHLADDLSPEARRALRSGEIG